MSTNATKPIFRIQDKDGRGPFRPGITDTWCEYANLENKPAIFDEFGESLIQDVAKHLLINNGAFGCGCSSLKSLQKWFSESELAALGKLGFELVEIIPDKIFAESDKQVVFWCKKYLFDAPINRIQLANK